MITAIGMIKNSADIIEAFIRGNSITVDNFVLLNNMCTDSTLVILRQLQQEGFQIEILDDSECAYMQSMKMNLLIRYVVKKYDPDLIIPLDDDEILVSNTEGVDPRTVLEDIETDKLYYVKWRIYVPAEEDDPEEICVTKRLQYCFGDSMDTQMKVIIPRGIAGNERALIVQGNHDMVGVDTKRVLLADLRLAHFPCRSEAQITSKALVGWTNYLAMAVKKENNGLQWKKMYDRVRQNEKVTLDMMWEICMMYLDPFTEEQLVVERKPLDLPASCFANRYTKANEVDPFLNYMYNTEQIAMRYAGLQSSRRSSE